MNERNDEVFSKRVKAGKRTYFFDVKTTRGKDLYLTITESKRTGIKANGCKHHYKNETLSRHYFFQKNAG